MATIVAKRN